MVSKPATDALNQWLTHALGPELRSSPVGFRTPGPDGGDSVEFHTAVEGGEGSGVALLALRAVIRGGQPQLIGRVFAGDPFVAYREMAEWQQQTPAIE